MSGAPDVLRVLAMDVHRFRGSRGGLVRLLRDAAPDVALLHRVPTHPLSGHRLGALASDTGLLVACAGADAGGAAVFASLRVEADRCRRHRGPGGGLAVVDARLTSGRTLRLVTVDASGDATDQADLVRHLVSVLGPAEGTPTVVAGPLPGTSAGSSLRARFADLTPDAVPTTPADTPTHRPLGLLGQDVDARALDLPGEPGRRPELLARVGPSRPVLVELTLR